MSFVPAYIYNDKMYLNITNRCPNHCCFCIRNSNADMGSDLNLDKEPGLEEILMAVDNLPRREEITFCGYGEPLLRPDIVRDVSRELKSRYNSKIRINTNGLAEKFLGYKFLHTLEGLVDTISISLNAENSEIYYNLCLPETGKDSYESVLEFAKECKKYIPRVILSVVDIPEINIEECKRIAETIGAEFRVRSLIT